MKSRIVGLRLDPTKPAVWRVLQECGLSYKIPEDVRDLALGWVNNAYRCAGEGPIELDIRILLETDSVSRGGQASGVQMPYMHPNDRFFYGVRFMSGASDCRLDLCAWSYRPAPILNVAFGSKCLPEPIRRTVCALGAESMLQATRDKSGQQGFDCESTRADIGKLRVVVEGYL